MSAPDSPPDESLVGFSARGYGNLSEHIGALRGATSDAERRLADVTARTLRIRSETGKIRGHGKAEKGAVSVTVDASGRLTDIDFTPAALRLGSIDRLREAILDAAGDAVDDATTQYLKLTGVGADGIPDPLGDFLGGMPEVTEMLPSELLDRLQGKPTVDAEDRAARRQTRALWEGPNPYE